MHCSCLSEQVQIAVGDEQTPAAARIYLSPSTLVALAAETSVDRLLAVLESPRPLGRAHPVPTA